MCRILASKWTKRSRKAIQNFENGVPINDKYENVFQWMNMYFNSSNNLVAMIYNTVHLKLKSVNEINK